MDFGPLVVGVVFVLVGVFVIAHVVLRRDRYWDQCAPRGVFEMLGETRVMKLRIAYGVTFVIVGILAIGWFISQMVGIVPSG